MTNDDRIDAELPARVYVRVLVTTFVIIALLYWLTTTYNVPLKTP